MPTQQEDVSAAIAFVKLVEQNPCLWNYTLKNYCRTDLTSIAWKKIAENLNDTEQSCRERWKNIRTAFGRSMKPPKSGSGGRSKKPYYLATYLEFLRPYMKGASTSGNIPPEEEINHDTQTMSSQDVEDTLQDIPDVTPADEALPELEGEIRQDPTPSKRKRITCSQSDTDKSFNEWLELKKQKEMKMMQEEQNDGDWLFFRSLLPDFKNLNDKRKRCLKLQFVTLLNNEMDRADTEAEASNSAFSWDSSRSTFQPHTQGPATLPTPLQDDNTSPVFFDL